MSVETEAASGGGAWAFVEKQTASTSATVTFSHTIEAAYDYEIVGVNILPDADITEADNIVLQLGTGGGPTFVTSGYVNQGVAASGTSEEWKNNLETVGLMCTCHGIGGVAATELISPRWYLYHPGDSVSTGCQASLVYRNISDVAGMGFNHGSSAAATHTAMRIETIGSNTFTGDFLLYRRAHS